MSDLILIIVIVLLAVGFFRLCIVKNRKHLELLERSLDDEGSTREDNSEHQEWTSASEMKPRHRAHIR